MSLPENPTDGSVTEHHGWRNLTPHPIRLCGPWAPSDGADMVLLPWPDLPPLRLEEEGDTVNAETLHTERPRKHGMNGWTLRTVTYKAPAAMPPMEDGVRWVVSLPCLLGLAAAGLLKERPDLFAPDTGAGAIRDEKGQIIGSQGFVRLATPRTAASQEQPTTVGHVRFAHGDAIEAHVRLRQFAEVLRPIIALHRQGAQGLYDQLFQDFEDFVDRLPSGPI